MCVMCLPDSTHAKLLPYCTQLIPHVGKFLQGAIYTDAKSMLEVFHLWKYAICLWRNLDA